MSKRTKPNLHNIYSDKTSGSTDILKELHEHLKGEQKMLEIFPQLIDEIRSQFKTFRSVQKYINNLENELKDKKRLDNFFSKYDDELENVFDKIFNKAKTDLIKHKKFITLSNSRTVLEILIKLKHIQPRLEVTVCESRPKYEARIMAKELAKSKIDVNFITDAAMSSYVKNSDAALIGADAILKNGNVINKIGSLPLAIICKFYSIPFYVAADKSKISSSNKFEQKEMPSSEIWQQTNPKIKIKNLYFEETEKSIITKILTA